MSEAVPLVSHDLPVAVNVPSCQEPSWMIQLSQQSFVQEFTEQHSTSIRRRHTCGLYLSR